MEWLSSKAAIYFDDGYFAESFNANIRLKRDSAIWMNFSKFSFEGARMLITPDSVYLINRLNSTVMVQSFSHFQKTYNLPVNFEGLQALLLGNPVFFSRNTTEEKDSMRYHLIQKTERLEADYWLDNELQLVGFNVKDLANNRSLSVNYADYRKFKGKQKFSYFRTYNLLGPESGNLKIEIEFSKLEVDIPKSLDFQIPSQYERVD